MERPRCTCGYDGKRDWQHKSTCDLVRLGKRYLYEEYLKWSRAYHPIWGPSNESPVLEMASEITPEAFDSVKRPSVNVGAGREDDGMSIHTTVSILDVKGDGTHAKREDPSPGYHVERIERGEVGEFSKVREEFEEALDAQRQGAKLMLLLELSDMIGAIELFLEKHHPTIGLADLIAMANVTRRAFENGCR